MIYIDLGAYNGDTVEQFINWGQLLGDLHECLVYGFEPNPNFKDSWDDIIARQSQHVKHMEFINKAAWIDDEGIELSIYENPTGSSLMPDKRDYEKGKLMRVETFDFSKWLRTLDDKEIYIKFDIEGSEYPILKKMIADGTDRRPKLCMVEWHGTKMNAGFMEDQKFIEENLKCQLVEWR